MQLKAVGDFIMVEKVEEKEVTGLMITTSEVKLHKMHIVDITTGSRLALETSTGYACDNANVFIYGKDIAHLPHITVDSKTYYFIKYTDILAVERFEVLQ